MYYVQKNLIKELAGVGRGILAISLTTPPKIEGEGLGTLDKFSCTHGMQLTTN